MSDQYLSEFVDRLLSWYVENKRDLPWRDDPTPYAVWVSEVMLQQTTVPAVEGRFERWMRRFPDVESVAENSEEAVLSEWEGLGYYQRASRLHLAARRIVTAYDGSIPRAKRDLLDLPGVGPYIAAAIRSLAFGEDEVAVDANICRVFMRLCLLEGRTTDAGIRRQVWEKATEVLPSGRSSRFNQSLMDFGSLVCRPIGPRCGHCFATDLCRAFQEGMQEEIPQKGKKKIEEISTAVAVFIERSRVYIQKRPSDGLFAGMWEFPGGKVKDGEGVSEAVVREVKEELGVDCEICEKVTALVHYYTRFKVTLHAFVCHAEAELPEDNTHRWVDADIAEYPMPSANRTLIKRLQTEVLE